MSMMRLMGNKPRIEACTDGACSGNPGAGGWGVLLKSGKHKKELCGGEKHTTNQRMELMAAIEALRSLKGPSNITIYSDSKYVIKGITEWIHGWKKNGWKNASRKPVANDDLWKQLDTQAARHQVIWQWVKGHAGHPGNERADELARQGVPK